ncbi:hypothetical protein EC950183_4979, partial [Escherichia coli 95.0183]
MSELLISLIRLIY